MTAEIAVLNRHAVALAADSAVTLQLPEGPKIYQTNKLFTLSKYHPVGVMIYGSAEFMGVPWETIIKQYRSKLGARSFEHLEDYSFDFLRYLERTPTFFPPRHQKLYCEQLARVWLRRLKRRLRASVEEKLKTTNTVSTDAVKTMFRNLVRDDISHLRRHKNLPRFSKYTVASFVRSCGTAFRRAITDEVKEFLDSVPMATLKTGCALAIMRDLYWNGESGIVIAGFGNNQFLPGLRCFRMDSIIDGKLRVQEELRRRTQITTSDVTASVLAFAQSEMVALFMNGVDSDYSDFVRSFIAEVLLKGYPSMIEKTVGKSIKPMEASKIVKGLRKIGKQLTGDLASALNEYSKTMHSDPIVEIVNYLPKEELAAMAEALVNLTSFKRHVTRQAETVGGPIDVAVISRGDGFVWIKRKHYFSRTLNPHFLSNYFRNDRTI